MYRYIEYMKMTKRDLEENFWNYLKAIRDLAEKYHGEAYIFGSYIRGEGIGASDVDILIEVPDDVDRLKVLHEVRKLVPNRRIEIHVLNKSDAIIFKGLIKQLLLIDNYLLYSNARGRERRC